MIWGRKATALTRWTAGSRCSGAASRTSSASSTCRDVSSMRRAARPLRRPPRSSGAEWKRASGGSAPS
eukprot:4865452-Lingulodinium_polyedra.AAC.1